MPEKSHWLPEIFKNRYVKISVITIAVCAALLAVFGTIKVFMGDHIVIFGIDLNPQKPVVILKKDTVPILIHDTIPKTVYVLKESKYVSKKPITSQKIDSGSSGLQNNAPNYGNQAGRDITVNAERVLTSSEKEEILIAIKQFQKENNKKNCIYISSSSGSKGDVVLSIKDFLKKSGYDAEITGHVMAIFEKFRVTIFPQDINCMALDIGIYR